MIRLSPSVAANSITFGENCIIPSALSDATCLLPAILQIVTFSAPSTANNELSKEKLVRVPLSFVLYLPTLFIMLTSHTSTNADCPYHPRPRATNDPDRLGITR